MKAILGILLNLYPKLEKQYVFLIIYVFSSTKIREEEGRTVSAWMQGCGNRAWVRM
jgi:hypothetical protein